MLNILEWPVGSDQSSGNYFFVEREENWPKYHENFSIDIENQFATQILFHFHEVRGSWMKHDNFMAAVEIAESLDCINLIELGEAQ